MTLKLAFTLPGILLLLILKPFTPNSFAQSVVEVTDVSKLNPPFSNTTWVIKRVEQEGLLLRPSFIRKFHFKFYDSTVSITSFCNLMHGGFSTDGNKVLLKRLMLTDKVCPLEEMDSERDFFDLLKEQAYLQFQVAERRMKLFLGAYTVIELEPEQLKK